jgi:N-acetyl-gamma-glutamyl-phosphate reductase
MANIMKVGIIGASGYTGQELVNLLIRHPKIDLSMVTSRAHAGNPLSSVVPKLGHKGHLISFVNPVLPELVQSDIELFFLALPHGTASEYAIALLDAGKKIIDLSADFRLNSPTLYKEFYGTDHPAPQWLPVAQYGLPELHPVSWQKSPLIASPGCYPTSILVPLAPLLRDKLIDEKEIIIHSISGISGAGKNASERLLFCERNESAGAYGLPKHRHLSEIEEQLSEFAGQSIALSFHPHLAPMNRGLCSTISVRPKSSLAESKIRQCWENTYSNRPFVQVLGQGQFPETGSVVGTNRIDISVSEDARMNRYILCSAEDNLLKGAGGQAVQTMNLCNGYAEDCGLE